RRDPSAPPPSIGAPRFGKDPESGRFSELDEILKWNIYSKNVEIRSIKFNSTPVDRRVGRAVAARPAPSSGAVAATPGGARRTVLEDVGVDRACDFGRRPSVRRRGPVRFEESSAGAERRATDGRLQ
ncbi:MAG: hypothetical protein GX458_15960, partial [Phyllobacteriaceae bacterium]|nr:hypothetical protein [Phyllobacteriaceae bacterium]